MYPEKKEARFLAISIKFGAKEVMEKHSILAVLEHYGGSVYRERNGWHRSLSVHSMTTLMHQQQLT